MNPSQILNKFLVNHNQFAKKFNLVGNGVLASAALTFKSSVKPDNLIVFMSNFAKTFSMQL